MVPAKFRAEIQVWKRIMRTLGIVWNDWEVIALSAAMNPQIVQAALRLAAGWIPSSGEHPDWTAGQIMRLPGFRCFTQGFLNLELWFVQ